MLKVPSAYPRKLTYSVIDLQKMDFYFFSLLCLRGAANEVAAVSPVQWLSRVLIKEPASKRGINQAADRAATPADHSC